MATNITQIDDPDDSVTILRVEGDMLENDAHLLAKIGGQLRAETGNAITIDLADLDFLDSDAASVLMQLERTAGFEIVGMEIFRQTIVDQAEKR